MSRKWYLILALTLFATEVLIATCIHDRFIRPSVGDFLVVIFLYCCFRAFSKVSILKAAIGVLVFAYLVEVSQYFHLIRSLGLEHSTPARLILGNTFQWSDLVAYTLGIGAVLIAERCIAPSGRP